MLLLLFLFVKNKEDATKNRYFLRWWWQWSNGANNRSLQHILFRYKTKMIIKKRIISIPIFHQAYFKIDHIDDVDNCRFLLSMFPTLKLMYIIWKYFGNFQKVIRDANFLQSNIYVINKRKIIFTNLYFYEIYDA